VIKSCLKRFPIVTSLILIAFSPLVNAQSSLTLHDSLTAAIEKQSTESLAKSADTNSENSYTSWLDSTPSVSLMYLDSQQRLGTSETEVNINLPIKSPFLKRIEKKFSSNVDRLNASVKTQYALYLSGLIRNLMWDIQVERVLAASFERKQKMLLVLASHYKDMSEAQAIPRYVSLLVQKELNEHKLSAFQTQQNIKNLEERYFRLTGLRSLPNNINEVLPSLNNVNINSHPDVIALDTAFQSAEQQLLIVSKQAMPWNVQLTGKRVESVDFSENQLGIGLEVPITLGAQLSSTKQSEHRQVISEYNVSRQKLVQQLLEAQANLQQEYDFLQQKQALLNEGFATLQSLKIALQEMREANTSNQDFYIRTLLDTIDSEQERELNLIHIQRHIALIRQAAGITL
jgi:hypothetical protein